MKRNNVVILILSLLLIVFMACKKESTYYKKNEKVLLNKITADINFSYGFDGDVELDYIFPQNERFGTEAIIDKRLNKSLKKYKTADIIKFYETMYRLQCMYDIKIAKYKKSKNWKMYTHVNKYLYPPLVTFLKVLEKKVGILNPPYKEKLKKRKKVIKDSLKKKDKSKKKKKKAKDIKKGKK